jgi:pimeloyl-ACP methyl ester carboxylesterase
VIPADINPDRVDGAPPPTVLSVRVDDADLYVEVRGSGQAVLLVGAADEDAEIYRGIAERLAMARTVVSYDRRGTGRSDHASWPSDSGRHAGDAAALIDALALDEVTVFGASAGGLVTLRLALSHPERLRTVLCYERVYSKRPMRGEPSDAESRLPWVSICAYTREIGWELSTPLVGRRSACPRMGRACSRHRKAETGSQAESPFTPRP